MTPLVNFYSKLPKGEVTPRVSGIKGRYFSGANASGKPLVALIVGIFVVSYTLDYNSELPYISMSIMNLTSLFSALKYVGFSNFSLNCY